MKSTKNKLSIKFEPGSFEAKWQEKWESDKTYSPDLDTAKKPYYNLMMFPYPSAEGMHVGNMYAHTGADIHGRFKRMQGFDVIEPIGLDGFGIHSENFAMKVGRHPKEQAERSEKNFYRQMRATGSGFDWQRTLETYDPDYYKWTQWLFTQMFKSGLAYKDTAAVNYCPSCKTVLSDEQVIAGECERCGTVVEKRELEQWFFRITQYAGRLLDNIPNLEWTPKVKTAQKNWIGRSKGALITFPIADFVLPNGEKPNFVLLHGFNAGPDNNFFPWIKKSLEDLGYNVQIPRLPHTENPTEEEQVQYILDTVELNENTILFGHSLGAVVALKVAEKTSARFHRMVLAGGFCEPAFKEGKKRRYMPHFSWDYEWDAIVGKVQEIIVLHDDTDTIISQFQATLLAEHLKTTVTHVTAHNPHFKGKAEPEIINSLLPTIDAFTTRPDTLFGATFMVIAPEHPIVRRVTDLEYKVEKSTLQAVSEYVTKAVSKSEMERTVEDREKTGVFSGLYAVNPVSKEKIPVWIADYVLAGYGSGAIMAVPAHDERDYQFAKKYGLAIVPIIAQENEKKNDDQFVYVGAGLLQNSGEWNGYHSVEDADKILAFLSDKGIGQPQEQYHLRDWLISRQRYWGPPIPMIFCPTCADVGKSWFDTEEALAFANTKSQVSNSKKMENGNWKLENSAGMAGWYPVPDSDLPVLLPEIEDFKPKGGGTSPLAEHPEFYEVSCPECNGKARRETDVLDVFLDSAWYFLRYLATDWDDLPFPSFSLAERVKGEGENQNKIVNRKLKMENSKQRSKYLPVDIYIGGAEHSVLHLLYARFVTMVLHDLGYLDFDEPFKKFYAHGLLVKEGAKMSKSKGNVIIPDEYIEKYGADTLRSYLMFLGPFAQGGDFYDTGIEGMFRFLRRIWHLLMNRVHIGKEEERITRARHKTIAGVTEDMKDFGYNTSISKLMELYNLITEGKEEDEKIILSSDTIAAILKMLAPFAPHMTEEMWQYLKIENGKLKIENESKQSSIHHSPWPTFDPEMTVENSITIAIQVNGKRRGEIMLNRSEITDQQFVEQRAKKSVSKHLESGIRKVIYVPGKIINFVAN